jgi:hypothetical protein
MQRATTTIAVITIVSSAVISLIMGWRLQSGECVTLDLPLNSSIKIGEACHRQTPPKPQASPK